MSTTDDSPTLEQSMRIITVAGCLAMVYYTCISCPVVTDFCRELGASELQFGLLAGLPMILLVMQFVGAYLTDRVPRRKPYFMVLEISARLVSGNFSHPKRMRTSAWPSGSLVHRVGSAA